ncbi:MAG: glycosyltransferase family 2 protein [Gemmatimonadaceae bacterium]|nr:glycosyltransferase family 2 protein [Chitinophagaceae bacterium]
MKVSGFSYIRNGFLYDYPFLESIQSVLPLCDEFIMVVGDSHDGTREAIEKLDNPKIKIVDTKWDDNMREKGYIFAQQANIGLDHVTGDWAFHIQADEVIHEKDLPLIRQSMERWLDDKSVEGLLFHFINFFGDYRHFGPSRRYHNKEIRIVRNDTAIRSYRDSQGFRRYNDPSKQLEEKGEKLNVKLIDSTVYHYSYVKNPETQVRKQVEFGKRWIDNDEKLQEYLKKNAKGFNYNAVDVLETFQGSHPSVMQTRIRNQDWDFKYDPSRNNMSLKEKLLYIIQKQTGKQLFSYKNYRII